MGAAADQEIDKTVAADVRVKDFFFTDGDSLIQSATKLGL
jgi:hypothetical protein